MVLFFFGLMIFFFFFLLYTVTDRNIYFLIPDLCRATERNGNIISVNVIEDTIGTIKPTLVSAIFQTIVAVVLNSLTLQGKHNIRTLSYILLFISYLQLLFRIQLLFSLCVTNFPINILYLQNIVIFYTVFIEIFSHCSDCRCNGSFLLFFTGPPVIINNSVILLEDDEGCLLNVMFYSFNSNVKMTWYKNGRRLFSSEQMKQSFTSHKYLVEMHSILVPIDARTATLRINSVCDLDESIYSFTAHDVLHRTSYIFEKDGK